MALAHLYLGFLQTTANYALAQAAAATGTMSIVAPFLAFSAAWEAFTLRTLWGRLTMTRQWWQVLGTRLVPVAVIGLIIQVVGYVDAMLRLPQPGTPGWQMPVLSVLGVVAWTCFGAAVALVAGRLLTMTTTLLVPYLALMLPAGWEPLWLRHLNGNPFDCCSTSEVLDPRVMIGSAGVLGTILVLSLCVARVRLAPSQHRPWGAAVVAVAVLVAGGGCVSVASGLGPNPGSARPAGELVCQHGVCLWPEDTAAFDANRMAWTQTLTAWTHLGLPEPQVDRIGPITATGMLPVTTTSTRVESAAMTMALMLPRALVGCVGNYADQGRNERLDRLSVLLVRALHLDDPANPPIVVPDPQPTPADADPLWSATTRCSG